MAHKRILIIDGHPDAAVERYLHVLVRAYADGAHRAGHEVRVLTLAEMDVPLLATAQDFQNEEPSRLIAAVQGDLMWANHIVLMFPLWLGSMPAKVKALLEQVFRPGFAFEQGRRLPRKLLKGRSARVVVTMGMPAFLYTIVYRSHGVKSLTRNILAFCGLQPVRTTLIGNVEGMTASRRGAWIGRLHKLGETGT